jgi:1-acyl-sn-glycerol-3-phosphate acyltransferase
MFKWLSTFDNIEKKLSDLKGLDKKELIYRVMPNLLAETLTKYFRMTIEGTENIPRRGPAIIAPNHSGYSGFDAVLLLHHINKSTKRTARVLTHKLWFSTQTTAQTMKKFGFVKATKNRGLEILKKNQLMVLFPEGEAGNFKPTTQRYHLQEYKRGFIRLAIRSGAPIIPTLIIGAEETHINLAKLKLPRVLKNLILPLPLNIIPLPAKWHIIFLDPIYLPYEPEQADDVELVHEIAEDIREKMQQRLSQAVKKRKNLYF